MVGDRGDGQQPSSAVRVIAVGALEGWVVVDQSVIGKDATTLHDVPLTSLGTLHRG